MKILKKSDVPYIRDCNITWEKTGYTLLVVNILHTPVNKVCPVSFPYCERLCICILFISPLHIVVGLVTK